MLYLLGQLGSRTSGLIIGSLLSRLGSIRSVLGFSSLSDSRSLNTVDPPKRVERELPSGNPSLFCYN